MARSGIIPHIVVNGAVKAIEFYTAAYGAVEVTRMPSPDGRLMHAELKIGESFLFLCDDFPEYCGGHSRLLPAGLMAPVTFHMGVPNVDEAVAKAETAGAKVTMPAADMFWGDRYAKVQDPFGYEWSFSTPVAK